MAYPDSVPPGVTKETPGSGVYRTLVAELVAVFPDRVAKVMKLLISDVTTEIGILGLYCEIYDEQMAIWDALFPGMNPENIIKDGIPKFVQGINLLKLPNVDAEKNFPTNIAEYEQLGWIDPRLMSNGDKPHLQYKSAVTRTGMSILDRLVFIKSGGTLTMTRVTAGW